MQKIIIEKIVYGGLGLGRLPSGKIILTADALPEEQLTVVTHEQKKGFALAEISEILHPSPYRCTPQCHWCNCGGCDLNHSNYDGQIAIKEAVLDDLIERNGLKSPIDSIRLPVIGAKQQYHYRQRIRLQCVNTQLGFHARRSHSLVEIDQCILAPEVINKSLAELRQSKNAHSLLSHCSEVELLYNPLNKNQKAVLLLLHFKRKPRPADKKDACSYMRKSCYIESIFFMGKDFAMTPADITCNKEITYCYKDIGNAKFTLHYLFEAGSFSQLHLEQNRILIEKVLQYSGASEDNISTVLDLYCGMGNFSVPLALLGVEVLGIEGQGAAVRSAERNMKYNLQDNINVTTPHNATFQKAPVHHACKQLVAQDKIFDLVVIDPPRNGAPQLAPLLYKLTRKKMIYISCDPASLMRDIKALIQEGFSLTVFQPIDMFPQTHHIETIVVFEK